jgi:hypothetical protein
VLGGSVATLGVFSFSVPEFSSSLISLPELAKSLALCWELV